jgi:hypothetical protein
VGHPPMLTTSQPALLLLHSDTNSGNHLYPAHIADSAPLSAVARAAVTKRRSASSELLPRDQMRAWMSAAKCGNRLVGCTRRGARLRGVSGVITYPRNAGGLAGVLCLSLGPGLLAGGVVGRVHRDVRRPRVKTGAAQVAAPT